MTHPAVSDNFQQASQAILRLLHQRFSFDSWMITCIDEDNWVVLQAEDHGYEIKPGQVIRWDSSCHSPRSKGLMFNIESYSENIELSDNNMPITRQINIQAYMGYPLLKQDGTLFGTLCAIHPEPKAVSVWAEQEIIRLFADLLSMFLQNEFREGRQAHQLECIEAESLTDELTQLYNRRGWERLLVAEEERSRRHGHCSAVYMTDLDGLKHINDTYGHAEGDELIKQAAQTLKQVLRSEDILARLGGDEFAILTVEVNQQQAERLFARIEKALQDAQVPASIGYALRDPATSLQQALIQADQHMYFNKRHK